MTYLMLLPHVAALFMTSPTQIAEHTMAALTVVFLRLSNIGHNNKDQEPSETKLLRVLSLFPHSISIARARDTSSVRVSFKFKCHSDVR